MALLGMPRVERIGSMALTGIERQHLWAVDTCDIVQGIGRQWAEYMTRRAAPPWSAEAWRFGVTARMADGDTKISYFCCAPPPEPPEAVPGFVERLIPALSWAVFPFDGHLREFRAFVHDVFAKELSEAGFQPAPDGPGVPEFIERYDWRFNPAAGKGGFDVLVPVAD